MRHTFIQWKGTDLCMDMYCPECGKHSHFDGMFAYNVRCPHCKTVFEMPDDIELKKTTRPDMPTLDPIDDFTVSEA